MTHACAIDLVYEAIILHAAAINGISDGDVRMEIASRLVDIIKREPMAWPFQLYCGAGTLAIFADSFDD